MSVQKNSDNEFTVYITRIEKLCFPSKMHFFYPILKNTYHQIIKYKPLVYLNDKGQYNTMRNENYELKLISYSFSNFNGFHVFISQTRF